MHVPGGRENHYARVVRQIHPRLPAKPAKVTVGGAAMVHPTFKMRSRARALKLLKCVTMCHMKRVNLRELHHHTGALIDDVAKGHVILVEKRGVPVAEIHPVRRRAAGIPIEHWEWLKKFPAMPGDSGELIAEDRNR